MSACTTSTVGKVMRCFARSRRRDKYIVVVDDDCDVQNTSEVLFRLCANTDPQRDSTFVTNPSDSLDHAPSVQNVGSHMGLDATR